MKKHLLDRLVKASGNERAGSIDVIETYNHRFHLDTGNYMLNALIGGSIYSGIPSGMIIQWAGFQSTGKSFLTTNSVLHHVKSDKNNIAIYIETEGAFPSEKIKKKLSADEQKRFLVFPVPTIEEITRELTPILASVMEKEEEYKSSKILITIDSIGMPASEKEKDNASLARDKQKRDMTRAQAIKSLFRTITMDLRILDIPMNVINHQYHTMDAFNPVVESSGTGMAYANSVTLDLRTKKLKDDNKVQVGTTFVITPKKSRIVAEYISKVEIYSRFTLGMDRFSGLWEFLKNHKLMTSKPFGGGKKGSLISIPALKISVSSLEIGKMKAEDFWTKEILDYIDTEFRSRYLLDQISEDSSEAIKRVEGGNGIAKGKKAPVSKPPKPEVEKPTPSK